MLLAQNRRKSDFFFFSQIGNRNGGALGVVGPGLAFPEKRDQGEGVEARRPGQRREWEEFEVLDGGMKKFPLKRPG